ncbi:MAG: hypothetical protein A2007_02645 [Verrucomicrobia bacterium GWC2_42_7]|nr:MAG: hypothetical protein A2007_02645 [Verrucomicrobia bacterium GWC2_42_7]
MEKNEKTSFAQKLYDLTELDYLVIEAYSLAIKEMENLEYKNKLESFKNDHERHITENVSLLKKHKEMYPKGPKFSQKWIVKGEVMVFNLLGDKKILDMLSKNEMETNEAYRCICAHEGQWDDASDTIKRGFEDEKRHKEWIDSVLC